MLSPITIKQACTSPPQSERIFNEVKQAYYIQLGILWLRCPKGNKQPSCTVTPPTRVEGWWKILPPPFYERIKPPLTCIFWNSLIVSPIQDIFSFQYLFHI